MSLIGLLLAVSLSIACSSPVTGVWSRWHINDGKWEEIAEDLEESGIHQVYYLAAYGPVIDRRGLEECLAACQAHDIDVHAWVVMWKTDFISDSLRNVLQDQSRYLAYSPTYQDGAVVSDWLDPTDPRNVGMMAGVCQEIAADYPVKGIHLDFIRYNYYLAGYSSQDKQRFMEDTGIFRMNWPDDCISGGRYYDRYMEWRADRITAAVQAVRDSLNRLNRVVELSAAVLPRTVMMRGFGQMWDHWLQSGLLDFVVTMNYTSSDSEFVSWGQEQLALAAGSRILCGIGVSTDNVQLDRDQMLHQAELAENMGFPGTVVYHLGDDFLEMLPLEDAAEPE